MGERKGGGRSRRSQAPASEPAPLALGVVEGLVPSTDPTAPDFAWWPIDRVKPWVRNPRRNAKAVKPVAESIATFGWGRPLVVNVWPGCEGELIIGHTAWAAAQHLKLTMVPVRIRRMEPPAAHALAIADNKLGELSDWDPDELGRIIGSGELTAHQLNVAGFSAAELRALTNPGGLTDDDDVPAAPAEPITQPGDLWLLGDHRLVCGDSTRADHVELLLAGAKPALMVTDPPYGVNYDPEWRSSAPKRGIPGMLSTGTGRRTGVARNDHRDSWLETWRLFPGAVAYVWHAGLGGPAVARDLVAAGFGLRSQIIWAKSQIVLTRGHYHWQHEPCWYAVRDKATAGWIGDRKQNTLWSIPSKDRGGDNTNHSNQKPLECMARPMRHHDGDVYDPFVGSGTTLIAAQKLGRRCFAMELDPAHCDVVVERWRKLTGMEPQRQQVAA